MMMIMGDVKDGGKAVKIAIVETMVEGHVSDKMLLW